MKRIATIRNGFRTKFGIPRQSGLAPARESGIVFEEAFRQREAASQQAMIARLKVLESPSIGISSEASSNQHREARKVKISSWLRLGAGDR